MQIIQLTAENVKRLQAVKIEPNGKPLVVIGGKNGNGKTSVLDSIEMALGGGATLPPMAVRKGQKAARIVLTMDEDYVIERRIDAGGKTSLEVRAKNGAKYPKPQALLDSFCAKFSFDPLKFAGMKPAEQVELLRKVTGLDFAEIDNARAIAYDNRAGVNRTIKEIEGQLAGLPEHPDAPAAEVSVAALADEMNTASARNAAKERLKSDWDRAANAVTGWRAEVEKAERELVDLREKVIQAEEHLEAAAAAFEAAPDGGDLTPIRERMAEAEGINRRVRANQSRKELAARLEAAKALSKQFTEGIDGLDEQKRALLAAAAFPVPGLSIDEETVTVDGIPFEQLSGALQLRVSVAMGLALNPTVKVLLIRDGSLLDEENLGMVAEMAAEAGAQVWLERVGAGQEVAIVLEDGTVKENRGGDGA
jgi:DNA repair exonuclease SbcCD ATPase subunit